MCSLNENQRAISLNAYYEYNEGACACSSTAANGREELRRTSQLENKDGHRLIHNNLTSIIKVKLCMFLFVAQSRKNGRTDLGLWFFPLPYRNRYFFLIKSILCVNPGHKLSQFHPNLSSRCCVIE